MELHSYLQRQLTKLMTQYRRYGHRQQLQPGRLTALLEHRIRGDLTAKIFKINKDYASYAWSQYI